MNLRNSLIIDTSNQHYDSVKFNGETRDTYEWAEFAKKNKYDGVIFKSIYDGVDYSALQNTTQDFVTLKSNQIKSVDNRGTFSSSNPDILYQLSPEYVRENFDYPSRIPEDEDFLKAVEGTEGASLVEDGIIIDLERWQKPEQDDAESVRTGVFYLPRGNNRYIKNYMADCGNYYGGSVQFIGETLLKVPYVVKGGTGGGAPYKAYKQIFGEEEAIIALFEAYRSDPRNIHLDPEVRGVLSRIAAFM